MSLLAALELSLLAVCLWGLGALMLTGEFSSAVILASMAGLLLGFYYRKRGWRPTPLLANIAAACVFLICGTVLVTTFNLLSATVYLFILLQVTKYVTRQNLEEIRWCYLISLFHIIGTSVITTTITFGLMLVVYIFLILVSLRLYVMARAFQASQSLKSFSQISVTSTTPEGPEMPSRMLRTSGGLLVFVLLLSSALFSAIPRLATQNLFQQYGKAAKEPSVSAFSENVEFGSMESIQLDDAVALFVEPLGGNRPKYVRMRGVALDTFDGKSWRRSSSVYSQSGSHTFHPQFTTRSYDAKYSYRVLQPPGITNFLFGDSFPLEITVPSPFIFMTDAMAQTVYLPEMAPKEFQYQVMCMHEDLNERQEPVASGAIALPTMNALLYRRGAVSGRISSGMNMRDFEQWAHMLAQNQPSSEEQDNVKEAEADEDKVEDRDPRQARIPQSYYRPRTDLQRIQYYLAKCLKVPTILNSGRVPELAREWTADDNTTFAKAITIERRLRQDYTYSLTPRAKGNFIDDFLFEVREGHCEYFATSMAILLRNLGIPARVVNGYYSSEWNSFSNNFTVRHKDAHSWVEAWLGDNYGWMTFDPTPPGGVARRANQSALLSKLSSISDAIQVRWYRYVVDYNISDQVAAFHKVIEWRQRLMNALGNASLFGLKTSDLKTLELEDFTRKLNWQPVVLLFILLIALLLWQVKHLIRKRQKSRWSNIRFYDELLKLLARHGLKPQPGQTPREFAYNVAQSHESFAGFIDATELYYASRYHKANPAESDLHRIKKLKNAIKETRPQPGA